MKLYIPAREYPLEYQRNTLTQSTSDFILSTDAYKYLFLTYTWYQVSLIIYKQSHKSKANS